MVIGGISDTDTDTVKLSRTCNLIGQNLAELHHDLIICSPFEDSADFWTLEGYAQSGCKNTPVQFYYIDTPAIKSEIKKLESNMKMQTFLLIPCQPPISEEYSLTYSWLLCQLQALESCQAVIAIGGKTDGSANMLLLLAEYKHKLILPLTTMDGAASQSFFRRRYDLMDKLGDNYSYLQDISKFKDILNCYETTAICTGKNQKNQKNQMSIFISYPRERPNEADYIENILRRRDLKVFRDESEFGAGYSIPMQITDAINSANIFVAVWCAEYACSPWCCDELELALDRKESGKIELWIFCVDDTRIVPKRARDLVNNRVKSRDEIEGTILKLLNH